MSSVARELPLQRMEEQVLGRKGHSSGDFAAGWLTIVKRYFLIKEGDIYTLLIGVLGAYKIERGLLDLAFLTGLGHYKLVLVLV